MYLAANVIGINCAAGMSELIRKDILEVLFKQQFHENKTLKSIKYLREVSLRFFVVLIMYIVVYFRLPED